MYWITSWCQEKKMGTGKKESMSTERDKSTGIGTWCGSPAIRTQAESCR